MASPSKSPAAMVLFSLLYLVAIATTLPLSSSDVQDENTDCPQLQLGSSDSIRLCTVNNGGNGGIYVKLSDGSYIQCLE